MMVVNPLSSSRNTATGRAGGTGRGVFKEREKAVSDGEDGR
jgi:hypothetical protein